MRLKIYLLPLIMQEVDAVTEQFINLIRELRLNDDPEMNSQFLELRAEITKRIDELEQFFEANIRDTRVSYIEKARIKLKKLLMYDPDVLNKMQNENFKNEIEKEVKQKEINVLYFNKKKESSGTEATTERALSPNPIAKKISSKTENVNINTQKQPLNLNLKSAKKPIGSSTKEATKLSTIDSKHSGGQMSDRKVNETVKSKLSSGNATSRNKQSSTSPNKKGNEYASKLSDQPKEEEFILTLLSNKAIGDFDPNAWKEICFKLKLSDNEYRNFVREKANKVSLK